MTCWSRDGNAYLVELCLAQHQVGSYNLLELSPIPANFTTSSLKNDEVQADSLGNCGDGFPSPERPGKQGATTDQDPAEPGRRWQLFAAVRKARERKQDCKVSKQSFHVQYTQSNSLLCMAAVSHFGNNFQPIMGIVRSLESVRLGERLWSDLRWTWQSISNS